MIQVRQNIRGVPADMTSYGRFLDRLERRDGRWAIRERASIYERDRLDPVEPSEAFDKLFTAADLSLYPHVPLHGGAAGQPVARSRRWSITTAPHTPRSSTRATTRGLRGSSPENERNPGSCHTRRDHPASPWHVAAARERILGSMPATRVATAAWPPSLDRGRAQAPCRMRRPSGHARSG